MISKEKLEGIIFTFIIIIIVLMWLVASVIEKNNIYYNELEYKNKIIMREYGKNFESYEDYLLWRIEKGRKNE